MHWCEQFSHSRLEAHRSHEDGGTRHPAHVILHVLIHVSVTRGTVTSKVYARHTYDREKRAALNTWGNTLEQIIASADGAVQLSLTEKAG